MCVAVPGRIIEIKDDFAKVNIMNNITNVNIRLVDVKIGDYVLVHAGVVIEVMKHDIAQELIMMFTQIQEEMDDYA